MPNCIFKKYDDNDFVTLLNGSKFLKIWAHLQTHYTTKIVQNMTKRRMKDCTLTDY